MRAMEKRWEVFQVVSHRCSECLFTPEKIVDDHRKQVIIEQAVENNNYFTCHQAMLAGRELCCRGFFDEHKYDSLVTRLAAQLNLIEFIDLPNK